jgi:hypothetical protein
VRPPEIAWLWAVSAALLALSCGSCAGWPWDDPQGVQLPLGGDQECSHSPDIATQCCMAHDAAYWVGGTSQDRFTADAEFLACMALWGVPEPIAWTYYTTVRKLGKDSWRYTEHRTRRPVP